MTGDCNVNRFRCLCAVSHFFRCHRHVAAAAAIPLSFRCLMIAQQLRYYCAAARAALVLSIRHDSVTARGEGGGGGNCALRLKYKHLKDIMTPFFFGLYVPKPIKESAPVKLRRRRVRRTEIWFWCLPMWIVKQTP